MLLVHVFAGTDHKGRKWHKQLEENGFYSTVSTRMERLEDLHAKEEERVIIFDFTSLTNQEITAVKKLLSSWCKRAHKLGLIALTPKANLAERLSLYDLGIDIVLDIDQVTILPAVTLALYRRITKNYQLLTDFQGKVALIKIIDKSYILANENLVLLSPAQSKLFRYLLATSHRYTTRPELIEAAGLSSNRNRSLFNVHMHNLRQKFAAAGISDIITTTAAAGYQLNQQAILKFN